MTIIVRLPLLGKQCNQLLIILTKKFDCVKIMLSEGNTNRNPFTL